MRPANTMSLVRFGCVSRPPSDVPEAALRRMARVATERHQALGLTGELRFDDGAFSQVIEGPCDAVVLAMSDIIGDARHRSIEVTDFAEIEARAFGEWCVVGLDDSPVYCRLGIVSPVAPMPVETLENGWVEVTADGRA